MRLFFWQLKYQKNGTFLPTLECQKTTVSPIYIVNQATYWFFVCWFFFLVFFHFFWLKNWDPKNGTFLPNFWPTLKWKKKKLAWSSCISDELFFFFYYFWCDFWCDGHRTPDAHKNSIFLNFWKYKKMYSKGDLRCKVAFFLKNGFWVMCCKAFCLRWKQMQLKEISSYWKF